MIQEFTRFKIGAEAAAGPCRDTLRTKHRDVKEREMSTDPDLSLIAFPRHGKRPTISRYNVIQNRLERANVGLSVLVVSERHLVDRRNMPMDQQTLHDFCEFTRVARQALEQIGVAARIAHCNRPYVASEVHPRA
jgi:hypothetical protein